MNQDFSKAGPGANVRGASSDPFRGTSYRAIGLMGTGAAERVYLVEHRETGRRCVAKVLRQAFARDRRIVDRLRLEAQALGRLNHAHIVSILEMGTMASGQPFVVMDLLPGCNLSEELSRRGGDLPVLDVLVLTWQLMTALEAVHELGIVHRDIQPSNLFLCELPEGGRELKVLGFGAARVLPGSPDAPAPLETSTKGASPLGCSGYASPEQLLGKPADPRSDLYSAGLVLYRMLAGRGPFDHLGSDAQRLQCEPAPPSRYARSPIASELDRLVLRLLAKAPKERWQTAGEVRAALEAIGEALLGPLGWAETVAFRQTASGTRPLSEGELGYPGVPRAPHYSSFSLLVSAGVVFGTFGAILAGYFLLRWLG